MSPLKEVIAIGLLKNQWTSGNDNNLLKNVLANIVGHCLFFSSSSSIQIDTNIPVLISDC